MNSYFCNYIRVYYKMTSIDGKISDDLFDYIIEDEIIEKNMKKISDGIVWNDDDEEDMRRALIKYFNENAHSIVSGFAGGEDYYWDKTIEFDDYHYILKYIYDIYKTRNSIEEFGELLLDDKYYKFIDLYVEHKAIDILEDSDDEDFWDKLYTKFERINTHTHMREWEAKQAKK